MAWIESHQSLRGHPKTWKVSRELGISRPAVVGHLQFLWWWALDYAPLGSLANFSEPDIAGAAGWEGDPHVFVTALEQARFLERRKGRLRLHDWSRYAGRLIEQREHRAKMTVRNRSLYADYDLVRAVRERDGNRCRYCGIGVNWKDRRGPGGGTYDHVDPTDRQQNSVGNVVVACRSCNSKKGNRKPAQAGMRLLGVEAGKSDLPESAGFQPNRTLPTVPNQTKDQSSTTASARGDLHRPLRKTS